MADILRKLERREVITWQENLRLVSVLGREGAQRARWTMTREEFAAVPKVTPSPPAPSSSAQASVSRGGAHGTSARGTPRNRGEPSGLAPRNPAQPTTSTRSTASTPAASGRGGLQGSRFAPAGPSTHQQNPPPAAANPPAASMRPTAPPFVPASVPAITQSLAGMVVTPPPQQPPVAASSAAPTPSPSAAPPTAPTPTPTTAPPTTAPPTTAPPTATPPPATSADSQRGRGRRPRDGRTRPSRGMPRERGPLTPAAAAAAARDVDAVQEGAAKWQGFAADVRADDIARNEAAQREHEARRAEQEQSGQQPKFAETWKPVMTGKGTSRSLGDAVHTDRSLNAAPPSASSAAPTPPDEVVAGPWTPPPPRQAGGVSSSVPSEKMVAAASAGPSGGVADDSEERPWDAGRCFGSVADALSRADGAKAQYFLDMKKQIRSERQAEIGRLVDVERLKLQDLQQENADQELLDRQVRRCQEAPKRADTMWKCIDQAIGTAWHLATVWLAWGMKMHPREWLGKPVETRLAKIATSYDLHRLWPAGQDERAQGPEVCQFVLDIEDIDDWIRRRCSSDPRTLLDDVIGEAFSVGSVLSDLHAIRVARVAKGKAVAA